MILESIFSYDNRFAIIFVAVVIIAFVSWMMLKSPFEYPYYIKEFDVSNKREPKMEDQIDRFINEGNFRYIQSGYIRINEWKQECKNIVKKSRLKNLRIKQYERCLDDSGAFVFIMTRDQTRYRQSDYHKISYTVKMDTAEIAVNYAWVYDRYKRLKAFGFQCTLYEYACKDQRKLMTKELRDKIKARDDFTCQICGKYMPDEVGLHIDHIKPISKGGKSIPSNLQVLCDKCNLRKSDSFDEE